MKKNILPLILFGTVAFLTSASLANQCSDIFAETKANQATVESLTKIQELTDRYQALSLIPQSRVVREQNGESNLTIMFTANPRSDLAHTIPHLSEIQIEQTLEQAPTLRIRSKEITLRMNGQAFPLTIDLKWAPPPPSGAADRYANSHYQGVVQTSEGKKVLVQVQMVVDMKPELQDGNQGRGFVDLFVVAVKN